MPQYCCVPGCTNNVGGHRFPRDSKLKNEWMVAIKWLDPKTRQLWAPKKLDVVCGAHFREEDYRPKSFLGEKKRLLENSVPSIFSFRQSRRTRRKPERKSRDVEGEHDNHTVIDDVPDIGAMVDIKDETELEDLETELTPSTTVEMAVQCSLPCKSKYSIYNFKTKPKAILYLTGFYDFDYFMFFFNILGPAASDLKYKCNRLSPQGQLFLTLMKLRQSIDDAFLSLLFDISESTVSRIVCTWINFLYFQLKEIDIWPSKSVIQDTMPAGFKKMYPSTRVILDATEIPIQKPTNVNAQSATYSNYKSKNTLKTMVGCSSRGLVTYVSDAYGGSTSDRQIIERSNLFLPGKLQKNDSIMADRGIMVQDLFANYDVTVNTPTMLKGKSQLDPEEVVKDRRVASKRVHVERVIGLGKTYKILTLPLPSSKIPLGSRILYVCFMLSNFKKSIVSRSA